MFQPDKDERISYSVKTAPLSMLARRQFYERINFNTLIIIII